jgi:hypothetical protein
MCLILIQKGGGGKGQVKAPNLKNAYFRRLFFTQNSASLLGAKSSGI